MAIAAHRSCKPNMLFAMPKPHQLLIGVYGALGCNRHAKGLWSTNCKGASRETPQGPRRLFGKGKSMGKFRG